MGWHYGGERATQAPTTASQIQRKLPKPAKNLPCRVSPVALLLVCLLFTLFKKTQSVYSLLDALNEGK